MYQNLDELKFYATTAWRRKRKEILKRDLQSAGHEVLDLGTGSTESVDYPDFGKAMADATFKNPTR